MQWLTPSPLWGELSKASDLTAYRRPAILRFANDTFMPELQGVLQQSPQLLRNYVAQGETWQNPTAGLGNPSTLPLKLFQPVQARFYVIAASLNCLMPGLPDHTINTNQGESLAFVVRQLQPNAGYSAADTAVYDPTKCTEYAWTLPTTAGAQPGWTQVPQTSPPTAATTLMPQEQLFPLSPSQTGSNGSTRRTLTGLIPASRRQQYISAQVLTSGSTSSGGGGSAGAPPLDPRSDLFNREVVTPWCLLEQWWETLSAADQQSGGPNDQSAQQASALILADFAAFLSDWIPDVWAAMQDSSKVSGLSTVETTLYNTLGPGLQQAILNAYQYDAQLESAGPSVVFPPGYTPYSLSDPGNDVDPTTLQAPINAALPPLSAVSNPPAPQPVPQKPSDSLGAYYFIVRCVYVRPKCPTNIISPPSQPFQLANYFDSDAPARRIQVALPIDTSAASFRKYDKGVSFLMSDELRNQMSRVTSLQNLANGTIGGAGGVTLGWICSFSIPIITICAMILLFVIVIALNLVFFWIPFFKICLPVPGLKGKSS